MGRIIVLRKESWVTRFWWGLWKWMRPLGQSIGSPKVQSAAPARALRPQMAEQLLHSQRRVVDELRRLNQILARPSTQPPAPRDRPDQRKIRFLHPRLKPQS